MYIAHVFLLPILIGTLITLHLFLVFVALLNRPPCNASHGVDGKVIAFDAETGRIRWQRTIGPTESSPLFADGLVVVGDWSHNVYAFTASTGFP